MTAVVKSQIIDGVADRLPQYSKSDVHTAFNAFVDTVTEAMANEMRVELRGFASWNPKRALLKRARNPKTGEPIELKGDEERIRIRFRAGKELRELVNESRNK